MHGFQSPSFLMVRGRQTAQFAFLLPCFLLNRELLFSRGERRSESLLSSPSAIKTSNRFSSQVVSATFLRSHSVIVLLSRNESLSD
jgi:hypothetical protein